MSCQNINASRWQDCKVANKIEVRWQVSMHLSQLISRERNPELREALEELDEFMNGY